jgi:tetratricopeptide (TPR) repeat protein
MPARRKGERLMPSSDREKRVERYRELSLQADGVEDIGKKDEALAILRLAREKAQKAGDEDYRLFFEAEIENYTEPNYDHQIALLKEALQWAERNSLPPDFFLYRNLGACYGLKGDENTAIEWFNKALAINPKDSDTMCQRGVSLSEKGDEDAAIQWFDKALAINPQDYRAMRNLGITLSNKGDLDAAIEWFDKALAINPRDHHAMRNRGISLSKKRDEDAAIEWFDKVLAINPKDSDAMRQRGVSLAKKGDLDAAIEWFDKALVINPKDHHAMCSRGVALGKKGDLDTAIEWIDKALATNPKDSDAMRERGVVLVNKGDLAAAIEWFDKALAVNPKDSDAMRERGAALSNKADLDAAIEWYDKALAINPKDSDAMCSRGVSLSNKGDLDAAIEWYDKALAINPKNSDAMRGRGVSLSKKGDLDAAIEWFDKALAINPKDYHAMRERGVCLGEKGALDAAIEWFDKALAHIPKNNWNQGDIARIHNDKSVALFNRGSQEDAFSEIVEAFHLDHKEYLNDFVFVCTATGRNPSEEALNIFGPLIPPDILTLLDHLGPVDIQVFIMNLRAAYADQIKEMFAEKEKAESKKKKFMEAVSLLNPTRSLFMVLRRWNSFTPAIPASDEDERSRGGGYFLWHNGRGTVVDPGYNFLENFREAGGRLCDIHDIIITHAHNDHTADFESITALLHEFNDGKSEEKRKRIHLFLNNSAFMKLSGMIDLNDKDYIQTIRTINAGDTFPLSDGAEVRVLQAFHPDVVSEDQAVGLSFFLDFGGKKRRILLTSDTGLYPQKRENGKLVSDGEGREIWEHYGVKEGEEPDLMLIHIGSIKDTELKNDYPPTPSKACYPHHLGIIGTARLITECRPRLAVISEFGEEMRSFRHGLIEGLQSKVIEPYFEQNGMSPVPRVVPGDLPFLYDVAQDAFFCCVTESWEPTKDIGFFPVNCLRDNAKETVIFYARREELNHDEGFLKRHAEKMLRMRCKDFDEKLGFKEKALDL